MATISLNPTELEQRAWERSHDRVGEEMHTGWKEQKQANGFADHPFVGDDDWCQIVRHGDPLGCTTPRDHHHDDMRPWEELSPEQQALNYVGGRIPFKLGYQAALEDILTVLGSRVQIIDAGGTVVAQTVE